MKFLRDLKKEELEGKRVLLRVDFNEPISGGLIQDDFKIQSHRETIDSLRNNDCKLLLVTHHSDKEQSFREVVSQISEILSKEITFVPKIDEWNGQEIGLLENVRQFDGEDENSDEFAQLLASGFDLYVNDAFSESHRARVSVAAITKFLPAYAGFLLEKEIAKLSEAINAPKEGKVIVMGGAKIETKLPVIKNFLDKAEKVLVGGALANDFFQIQGINVGASLVDKTEVPKLDPNIVIIPQDIIISKDKTGKAHDNTSSPLRNLEADELIVDIGPQSAELFAEVIQNSTMVIWNGPMGLAEVVDFAKGTEVVARAVVAAKQSIIGGGDTIAYLSKSGLLDKMSFASTGGGAMLAFLAGEKLPGLIALSFYE